MTLNESLICVNCVHTWRSLLLLALDQGGRTKYSLELFDIGKIPFGVKSRLCRAFSLSRQKGAQKEPRWS